MTNYKSAIVTGGTGTLGTAISQYLLANQYRLVIPCFFDAEIKLFEETIGKQMTNVSLIQTDLTKVADVDQLVSHTLGTYGKIDVLANAIGGFLGGIPTAEMDLDKWEFMLNLNLKSVYVE